MSQKLTQRTVLATTPDNADLMHVVDVSDTTDSAEGTSKQVTIANLLAGATVADASTTVKGKVELATDAETLTGTDTARAMTPSNLTAKMDTDGTLAGNSDTRISSQKAVKTYVDTELAGAGGGGMNNLLKNGNFINNSTNGYGGTPDDWTSSNANPVQGGIPALTKQNLIDILGVADGDIEGFWNLNGNFNDLSSNGYNLTASGSPTDSSDGLMAQAKDFESSSSQYANNAAANCRIAGSQTFFAFVKPESFASNGRIIAVSDSTPTNYVTLILQTSGVIQMEVSGISGNANSDVVLQTGKWYMIVGVYDTSAGKVKIWVNGIKKENTVTGSHTAGTGGLSIGRLGDYSAAASYYDGLVQNAGVLSVALSDAQVKRLFAATMYSKQKIRRATTNAYLENELDTEVVQRLRGRTIAIRADLYQSTASTAQISIHQTMADGTTDESIISATDATTGSWLEKYATGTLEPDVVSVKVRIKHSTTDGNTWFRNVCLYEGSSLLPYDHSKNDWNRFPRLLRMDIPDILTGYQFEENRLYDWTPSIASSGGTAPSYTALFQNKFSFSGKMLTYNCAWNNTAGGTAGNGAGGIEIGLPAVFSQYNTQFRHTVGHGFSEESAGTKGAFISFAYSNKSFGWYNYAGVSVAANDQSSTNRFAWMQGFYEI